MSKFSKAIGPLLPKSFERKLRDLRDIYLRKYKHKRLPDEIFEGPFRKISYCTTCMNRLFHLKETLKKNLDDNLNYPEVEFVLLNYNSKDELDEWIYENFMDYIESGKLVYYKTDEPENFHAPKAKNIATRLTTGEIICNLDGDNFLGEHNAYYINHLFKNEWNTLFHFFKKPLWGTTGRIALPRTLFYNLGGYNEEFLPLGFEDLDLRNRARAMGIKYEQVKIENFLQYLSNSQKEKSENVSKNPRYFFECNKINQKTSFDNIDKGNLVANLNDGWGEGKVYKNFQNSPVHLEKVYPEYNNTIKL